MAAHVHLCRDPQFAGSDDLDDDVAARLKSCALQPPTTQPNEGSDNPARHVPAQTPISPQDSRLV
jgi:hypothetical protein